MTEENLLIEYIDWTLIDPEKFEKLIYFLLNSIGMKNIIWRKGGLGVSATDGGRDLECEDHSIELDGSVRIEKWWIEVKYRTNTLEKIKVQETLMNAVVNPDVDVICIVTNNVITNPTQDWINMFKEQNKAKRFVIWQGHNLENIIKNNPSLIYCFFPSSLTLKGRFNLIEKRFYSYLQFPSGTDLIDIWEDKEKLKFKPKIILPIIFAEATFGDLFERQWGFWFEKDLLLETFLIGLTNILPLLEKCEEIGKESYFMMQGMEYLLLSNLLNFQEFFMTKKIVVNVLENLFREDETNLEKSYDLLNIILDPIISNICFRLSETCCNNSLCRKKIINIFAQNKYINNYIPKASIENSIAKKVMMIGASEDKCRFNMTLSEGICPLIEISNNNNNISDENSLLKVLGTIQNIFTKLRDTIFSLS